MREIPYVINRSRFLPIIEEHLSRLRNQLDTGLAVQIDFEIGGYNGDVTVVIHSNDAYAFQTDCLAGTIAAFHNASEQQLPHSNDADLWGCSASSMKMAN